MGAGVGIDSDDMTIFFCDDDHGGVAPFQVVDASGGHRPGEEFLSGSSLMSHEHFFEFGRPSMKPSQGARPMPPPREDGQVRSKTPLPGREKVQTRAESHPRRG